LPDGVCLPPPPDVRSRGGGRDVGDFWTQIHGPFLDRDLSRADVLAIVARQLADSGGNYRRFLQALGVSGSQYFKAMDFLRHHGLKPQMTGFGAVGSEFRS
jgi:hypothetical protein